jgi:hypothetical protein
MTPLPQETADDGSVTLGDIVELASPEECESRTYDESIVDSEYGNELRMIADTLITGNGEVIADVFAGIRDALDKLNKVLYTKLGK